MLELVSPLTGSFLYEELVAANQDYAPLYICLEVEPSQSRARETA